MQIDFNAFSDRRLLELGIDMLQIIQKEIIKMSTTPPVTQAAFDTALAAFQAQLTEASTAIVTALNDLIAEVQAGSTPVNLASELATIQSMATNLTTLSTTVASDDPGTPGSTPVVSDVKKVTVLPVPEQKS
jgi:hypothetical protein